MPWSHFLRCPSRWAGDLICIHLHTSPGGTPAALRWHCGGAGKFEHYWKASQVLTCPFKFFGHRGCLICKWLGNEASRTLPQTCTMYLGRGRLGDFSDALAISRSLGDGRDMGGRWHGGSTAMFFLSSGGCSVTPLPSSNLSGHRHAIMAARSASGMSGSPECKLIWYD